MKRHFCMLLTAVMVLCVLPRVALADGLPGDVNCDGSVNSADVLRLVHHLEKSSVLTSQGLANADIDGRTGVTLSDLAVLKQVIMGDKVNFFAPGVHDSLPDDPVRASSTGLDVADATGEHGRAITLKVNMKDNKGISAIAFLLGYDTTNLEVLDIFESSYNGTFWFNDDYDDSGKTYVMYLSSSGRNTDARDSELCEIDFQIKDTASPGDYSIAIEFMDASYLGNRTDSSGIKLQFPTTVSSLSSGTITVTGASPTTYPVTVSHGNGGGRYAQGATVTVSADAPESGKRF